MWLNIWAGLGPARPSEGTTWFRTRLGHCFYISYWHAVFILRAGTTRPKSFLGFPGLNPFDTNHDGLRPNQPSPIQFPALVPQTKGSMDTGHLKSQAETCPRPQVACRLPFRTAFGGRMEKLHITALHRTHASL
jgi:hypothetical protein